ncbi:MAG: DUF1572 family protein [Candidatus Hinthialibacter antarcticus]|nr:DUF1572 family protein [Candidatus Hinthialibacter antarcticus]
MEELHIGAHFIESARTSFEKMKTLAEKAIDQLSDEELLWMPDSETNSIAVIVQHLRGNMLSRWTDFLTSDGEKEGRDRDREFMPVESIDRYVLLQQWEEGWACVFHALQSIPPDEVLNHVAIRGEQLTVIEAIHRQISHYGYHVGQIVQIAKLRKGAWWKCLSIPKEQSKTFIPPVKN